ncbi:LANO_0H22364g1_1 [Lachancea nothofagi CBS 11611]|uniref:Restriction of telomere capping protein 5 n=1 Tax=Lachancea nothofagi CBS 11611 TaxID=1266666 RepID=A0A1G4KNR4_9SACH|nr:LANO_0H22364g1_1 [Lachancea nothofagi CBS 11611]
MGQTASVESGSKPQFENEKDILMSYDKRAIKSVTAPELISFRANIQGKSLEDTLTSDELMKLLRLENVNENLASLLFSFVQTLSNFPMINDCYENVTYVGVLKSCVLLSKERCVKYVHNKSYDVTKLVYIALALNKNVKELALTPASEESLDVPKIIATFNNVCIEELTVPADAMLEFVTLMLRLSKFALTKNSRLESDVSKGWDSFKVFALNLIRTMNPSIVTSQYTLRSVVTYAQFQATVSSACPNLLLPLTIMMEHVLYLERDLVDINDLNIPAVESKLVTEPLLSQLATFWPKELVFSRLQKLYVGRDSGFSMRSFQSKVFKWMAPSILLINGTRISDDKEYANSKNHRFQKFLDDYPRLKDEDQDILPPFTGKKKLMFAVYVNQPWRITNSELFGDNKTTIVQLSPVQEIYRASRSGNICFNTLGGGLGVGSSQPVVKNSNVKYIPGNVSLTIDSNLEFGAFRNVGRGGSMNPGVLLDGTSEHKFLIQDIEVWGCGGEKELEEQMKNWQWEEAEAQRRQRINLKSINDDRALLELAGLVGQNQSGGSM